MRNKKLAILSPGWGNYVFTLRMLESKFKSEGFDVIIVSNDMKGIKVSAAKLSSIIDNVYNYYDHICFVGHSMGGLVGRYLIHDRQEESHINSYVSLASPHYGCYLAKLGLWSKTAIEMKPNSELIQGLNSAEWPLMIPALSLQAGLDGICRPLNTTSLKHAENIVIPYASHISLAMSSRTFYEIHGWLCSIFFPEDFSEPPERKGINSLIK